MQLGFSDCSIFVLMLYYWCWAVWFKLCCFNLSWHWWCQRTIAITLTLAVTLHLRQVSAGLGLQRQKARISVSWVVVYGLAYVVLLCVRSWSHMPRGILHSTRKAAPRCHQRSDPFHVPHDPCAASSLTLPSPTDSHTHQTCNNFALLKHLAWQNVKTGWVRWYCGWQDAISPPLKQVLYRSRDIVGLLVLPRIRLGKAALSRRHYHNANQPCNTGILGSTYCNSWEGWSNKHLLYCFSLWCFPVPASEIPCAPYTRGSTNMLQVTLQKKCFLLWPNLVLLPSFRSKSVPLSHRINTSHQEIGPTQ